MHPQDKADEQELLRSSDDGNNLIERGVHALRRRKTQRLWVGANICFFLLTLVFFATSFRPRHLSDKECGAQLAGWTPALSTIEYETVRFSGFYTDSPYKGHPSEAIDKAWETLIHSGYISIPKDDFLNKLHKSPGHVRLPDDQGGGYWGNIEVYHQVHCLNLIRQYTYQDYYRQNPNILPLSFTDSDSALREHVDHCIDYIREFLMCAGDVSIHTYVWAKGRPRAFPDFKIERKCKNWDLIDTFARNAAQNITSPTKPAEGVVEYNHKDF